MKIDRTHLFKLVFTSILIALNIILERFLAYSVWNQSISFSFVTVAFAAAFFGAPYAVAVGGLGDIIGAVLFPIGAYFPGFTAVNILTALCTAYFIHRNATIPKIVVSVVINKVVGTLLLNTIWIAILYRGGIDAFPAVAVTRIPQAIIMAVVEIIVITVIFWKNSPIRSSIEKAINKNI